MEKQLVDVLGVASGFYNLYSVNMDMLRLQGAISLTVRQSFKFVAFVLAVAIFARSLICFCHSDL